MNPTDLSYIVLLAVSSVLFLNKHQGKELLFKVFYPHIRTTSGEYLRNKASRRFAKLWSCYFCQGAHVAHALSWGYGWWAGLSLMETCHLVLLATPVSAASSEMIIGFFDDVQMLAGRTEQNLPEEPSPKTPSKQPPPPNPLEAYVAERRKRGYGIDLVEGPDGKQSVLVKHVPERERIWEAFHSGKPSAEVPGLPEKWDTLKAKWEKKNCTRCERNAILAAHRDEVLELIDAHLKEKNGEGKADA